MFDNNSNNEKCIKNYSCCSSNDDTINSGTLIEVNLSGSSQEKNKGSHISTIILDMSAVAFVDEAGTKCLQKIVKEYKNVKVTTLFTNVNRKLIYSDYSL